ncbi:hypothetical protein NBRC110019_14720 [Neptunitalea chrysea]|uniref:Right handed beta helix domain-containing protein n=1 Tax=Neptunitalea chrysea TaxID=1647581 RepID=A0A9W6EVE7_9FLAO|nr:right-handed parallel beta-helix repeat-containing protein [Neptunitalea chrysea]GLB52432.1 hypothetical protein NBRC110019_14720 [Neptunitalea chrysea]
MKRYLLFLFIASLSISFFSCREDFEFSPSTGSLEFSKDTVYLDTVFTNIGSSTYNLKVYNHSNTDISIPVIRLANGGSSKFRLNVDGMAGKEFYNVELLAKDSMYVFIETTVDITDFTTTELQYLYTDAIEFDTDQNLQKIELVTLVQDAVFLYPERDDEGTTETLILGEGEDATEISGFFLDDDELNLTNEKPYVIYGYAAVSSGKTLTIDAGARIYFHADSGIIVASNGSLHVNGELSTDDELLENEVIFEGDRLEPDFADVPGQWGTIWLTQGSTENIVNYATIKNAMVGIIMDSNDGTANPTLTINNTKISNSSNYGLWAQTANVVSENSVYGNAGLSSIYCSLGGKYNFKHCTFANYWGNGYRSYPTVLLDNYLETNDGIIAANMEEANFYNCIIYGNNSLEFIVNFIDDVTYNYYLSNTLLKFNPTGSVDEDLYDFTNASLYNNVVRNQDPDFEDSSNSKYAIGEDSAANGLASPTEGAVATDINGTTRSTTTPDAGAYESQVFEED